MNTCVREGGRRIWVWATSTCVAWVGLTVFSAYVHGLAWSARGDDAAAGFILGERACKLLANVSQVLTLPGWVVMWIGFGVFESVNVAAAASGIGWACLFVMLWCIACVRVWYRKRTRPKRVAERENETPEAEPAALIETGHSTTQRHSRRAFLLDGTIVSAAVLGGGGVAHAALVGAWALTIRRYRVPVRGLPMRLDGLRLVQISDTHLGPRIPRSFIEQAVERALAMKPDLFVLTGDYVHMGRAHIEPAAELFRPLAAHGASALGVIGVLGNHDFYADGPAMSRALQAVGVRMIDNDRVFLDAAVRKLTFLPPEGEGLCIAGLGDLLEDEIDPRRALRDVPVSMPRVVLAHNPDTAEAPVVTGMASKKFYPADPPRPWWGGNEGGGRGGTDSAGRIDLMLSGHTHGGQIRVPLCGTPGIPSRFGQRYAHGLVQGPVCPVLISAGVGMSVLPVRVGVPPELVEVTLVRG